MKKKLIRIITLGAVLALLFTSAANVYADVAEEKETPDSTAEVQEPVKINIEKLTVVLERYLAAADGSVITPKVVSVSGRIDDEEGGVQKDLSLKPNEYDVKYYRVHSFANANYEEVEAISAVGEYKVAVTAKDTQTYEGEAYSFFSVLGKPQQLTIAKTKYTLTAGREAPLLEPKTDGDGTGFVFVSSDPAVVSVSKGGQTKVLKPGRAIVSIYTEGTTLFQPANLQVTFEVKPHKTYWTGKALKREKSRAALAWKKQEGVTTYEVVYGTQKNFAKQSKTKLVKGSLTKTTLKGLKKESIYYVKVRALTATTDTRGNKRTMEGPWSSVRKIAG